MVVLRMLGALVLGWITSRLVLAGAFAMLRAVWPEYADAAPERAYTLAMLLVRLVVFSAMIAATSAVATLVAGDRRFAWVTGGLILAISIPPHALPGEVWDAYPVWYHLTYLASILPIAVVAGRATPRVAPGAFERSSVATQ